MPRDLAGRKPCDTAVQTTSSKTGFRLTERRSHTMYTNLNPVIIYLAFFNFFFGYDAALRDTVKQPCNIQCHNKLNLPYAPFFFSFLKEKDRDRMKCSQCV